MTRDNLAQTQLSFPRPGRALWGVMLTLLGIWLMFAAAINWGGASPGLFKALCGNTDLILTGQVWRLFTAPLMHEPTGSIGHIALTLLGLYFLAPSLEEAWGGARLLRFLCFSVLFAYSLQMAVELGVPASLRAKLVPGYWYGALPAVEAVLIAFALTFRNRTVLLFFVLPVSSRGLVLFAIAVNVLMLIAGAMGPSGLVAPFGGMLAGWLFGGGTPSPLRRWWLRLRLRQLDREATRARTGRRRQAHKSGLRVIQGGARRSDDGGPNGSGSNGGRSGPGGLMH
jgi:membrane associated rhomboid family serine protease